jgi:hypothetical protein
VDDSDPLDIRQIAKPIDLSGDTAALERELQASLRIEGRKYEQGVYCELKLTEDWPNTFSCRTCPHRTEDPEDPMAAVCAMSMRQMDILDEIRIARSGGQEAVLEALAEAHGDWAVWEAEDLLAAHGAWAMSDAVSV